MRIVGHLTLALAVLIGQGASSLNLCRNCTCVCFDIDDAHSHDAGESHDGHDFVPLDHETSVCTQSDAAPVKAGHAPKAGAADVVLVCSAHSFLNGVHAFVPRATESPPPRFAPLKSYTLRC